jgi:hypothetical protein
MSKVESHTLILFLGSEELVSYLPEISLSEWDDMGFPNMG